MRYAIPSAFAALLAAFIGASGSGSQTPKEFNSTGEDEYEMRAYMPYRLLKPKPYDAAKKYPLVVFLHGWGERGSDNRSQFSNWGLFPNEAARRKYPCFVVLPQCPRNSFWFSWAEDAAKRAEVEKNFPTSFWRVWAEGNQKERLAGPNQVVLNIIAELVCDFSIDADRIYIGGISMGGIGTWDLITAKPDLFAAAFPICGGGDPAKADRLVSLPIWAFHGAADDVVLPDRSRVMIAAIKKAGGHPRYTEYPGVKHESWLNAYQEPDLLPWLFAQKRTRTSR
jgi:predicted peptidase